MPQDATDASGLPRRSLGPSCTVLFGARGGKYPQGNSLRVRGARETVLVDPSLGLLPRRDASALPRADRVLLSHCHEDHLAGAHLYPDVPLHLHEADHPGIGSLEGFMAIYGMDDPAVAADFREALVRDFHFVPRPDALPYQGGDVFELGGGVRIRAIHTPGHTRGHCALFVEPDEVLYLGDIDLSSFGPYYGDAWSDLEAFERTLAAVRPMRAVHYATFHHVGVLDREGFLARLARFTRVIGDREARLLAYLAEAPRSLDEIAAHRFVYRPGDAVPFAESVERRSMGQHLERLVRRGRVREVAPGRFRADDVG